MTTTGHSHSDCRADGDSALRPDDHLVAAFIDDLRGTHAPGTLWGYMGAARHFLLWLARRRIPLSSVDDTAVERFARHRCRCPRYRSQALKDPLYISHVRRFVRFLEERGDIPLDCDLEDVGAHLAAFGRYIETIGYGPGTQQAYRSGAEHFACWLRLFRIRWRDVDEAVIERFVRHRCDCAIRRKRGAVVKRSRLNHRRRAACRLIGFLRQNNAIPAPEVRVPSVEEPDIAAFRVWLKRHRGATDETIRRYTYEVRRWRPALGADPSTWNAAAIRSVVLDQGPERSNSSVQLTGITLRMFLRFLSSQGKCRPDLVHAVAPTPPRRLSTLPRYVSPAVIERIIDSCDTATPAGIRNRAIILLLARLGLRAGDVWRLRLSDIDWTNAFISVHGKGRRSDRLPLPQDAGDAVLAYFERARPRVREERVFLRLQAPFTPFKSAAEISGIVARVLARSGIEGVPSGAHMFRHSLATAMLRAGGSLESVGTVLRHSSPSVTAIYAKADVAMLERVAQPWPGDVSC